MTICKQRPCSTFVRYSLYRFLLCPSRSTRGFSLLEVGSSGLWLDACDGFNAVDRAVE